MSGPGLVIFSEELQPQAISRTAEYWIGQLRRLESDWMGPLPNLVYAVAARLQEIQGTRARGADLMPRARVQLNNGQWLAVQASLLTTVTGNRQIAVILEPPGPAEIAPLIVSAYSLTSREREIAQRALQGLSTKEIARELSISSLTVQQHLKAIFEKVGVHSRGELVGRVFEQQYWPRIKAGRPVGSDGWFAGGEPIN